MEGRGIGAGASTAREAACHDFPSSPLSSSAAFQASPLLHLARTAGAFPPNAWSRTHPHFSPSARQRRLQVRHLLRGRPVFSRQPPSSGGPREPTSSSPSVPIPAPQVPRPRREGCPKKEGRLGFKGAVWPVHLLASEPPHNAPL